MSNSVLITLIICIAVVILGICEVIYEYISERDNYASHKSEVEIESIKSRLKRIEWKIDNENRK